jgi:aromatic-ring opening dioxygenase LigAB LigA subunit
LRPWHSSGIPPEQDCKLTHGKAAVAIGALACKKYRQRQWETDMSVFAVNYLCREVLRDHAFRAAMKADPAKALAPLDLTDDERRALIAGDVGSLFRMGVNGFLMGYLARFEVCGLNVQSYNERMRAVKVDEIGQPVA